MEAKDKAKELIDNFKTSFGKTKQGGDLSFSTELAKQCALITVQAILDERLDFREQATKFNNDRMRYWQQVKSEIRRLDY